MRYLLVLSIVFSLLAGACGDWASSEYKSSVEYVSAIAVDDTSSDPHCVIAPAHVFHSFEIARCQIALLSVALLSDLHHYEPQAARAPPTNNA